MKKIVYSLVSIFIVSQCLVSCSSDNTALSDFSKRKYMKRFKADKTKYEDKVEERKNSVKYSAVSANDVLLAASADEYKQPVAHEVEIEKKEIKAETTEENVDNSVALINDNKVWSSYNRNWDVNSFSEYNTETKNKFNKKTKSTKSESSNTAVAAIIIALLCFFLPPVGVVLYEGTVTANFWVDLLLTLLFWLPGMIFAFLVCFGGVSV